MVTTTLVGSIAFYFAIRQWLRQRQAWQWWHQRQVAQLHEQAESIRDDLLQQTFAFRRYLESTLTTQPSVENTEQWLTRFQTFYQSLEGLSNQLSPPFVTDSLPLALQSMVQTWQQSHPGLTVRLDVPSDWPECSSNNSQIVLSIVTDIIELLMFLDDNQQQFYLSLERQDRLCTLTFKHLNYPSVEKQSFATMTEVRHLKEIFRSLTTGRLEIVTTESELAGQLCWQDN